MNLTTVRRVSAQRCFHHASREAVARCVACGRSYCRECVAEHDGRMICATCLRRETDRDSRDRGRWLRSFGRVAHSVVAVFVAWCFFYALAELLLDLPPTMHEGTMWEEKEEAWPAPPQR